MAFVHKEHGHIGRGKGLDASLTSPVVPNNENSYIIHKGKGIKRVKTGALQPGNAFRQERKALRDLTNATRTKTSALSEKSAPRSNHGTARKKAITDVKIEEWAAVGIEKFHYSDVLKFEKDRVKDWCFSELFLCLSQSPHSQSSEAPLDVEDVLKMELSPEVVLPPSRSPRPNTISPSILGDDECFHLYCEDLYFNRAHDWSLLRMKEEYDELVEDL